MLRFEDPIYLYMLLAVPALVLLRLALWRIRKKKLNALGDYALLKQLMPDVSKYRPTVKFYLLVAAYTMLVLLLDGRVHTKIECHRFFHGYHLKFIVTYFTLQINDFQTYN